jgi:protein HIRA/HIR1
LDIAGPRIATGGGDGSVKIWSMQALFSTRKSVVGDEEEEGQTTKMAQFTHKGYVSSDTSDAEALSSGAMDADEDSSSNGSDSGSGSGSTGKLNPSSKKRKRHAKAEIEKNVHRLLCKLSSHSGSVLALRFSASSTYLASAGDDSHVILYAQSTVANVAVSGNLLSGDAEHVEHWSRIRICRGHNLDVVGLAWAPDDSHLISCSLDSDAPICVWRMDFDKHDAQGQTKRGNAIMQPYKVLGVKEHTSTVKGVAFDPAGKYIASSGDDPALCIWRAFDDWGLESKVDSSSGIFQQDVQSLANLSMFRRISFAPDGSHVCATNAMLKKKNIAAMVSRDGWGVSAKKNVNVAGAANLVGHKQPVVSSRHCPFLLGKGEQDGSVEDKETHEHDVDGVAPEYSTLVALGDKKGFVTVWSTRKSRPIFKLQCSESRCAVTDMAWGVISRDDSTTDVFKSPSLILLVSLLDGFVVALRFDMEQEIGNLLSKEQEHAVFRHKYGIDLSSVESSGRLRKRLVDDTSGPKLIENVLQLEMEEHDEEMGDGSDEKKDSSGDGLQPFQQQAMVNTITNVRKKQVESRSKTTGKKRIQPVLISADGGGHGSSATTDVRLNGVEQNTAAGSNGNHDVSIHPEKITAEDVTARAKLLNHDASIGNVGIAVQSPSLSLPIASQKIYSVDLFVPNASPSASKISTNHAASDHTRKVVASCTNNIQSQPGTSSSTSYATITISSGEKVTWRDHLLGAKCTALDACSSLIALGSYDGSIYLFGTSPSLGWKSGLAFRSHPPLIMGGSVVHLSLEEGRAQAKNDGKKESSVEMIVVTSDGAFHVFEMSSRPRLLFKGTIVPAMNQMRLSASRRNSQKKDDSSVFPELSRIVYTESKELLLILCHRAKKVVPIGGLLQGFIYNRDMEIWIRISDNRFVFSNFFSTVPQSKLQKGILAKVDETVRSCSFEPSSVTREPISSASEMYYVNEDDKSSLQSFATKSHCEDRLACALMLQSKDDFEHWLRLYIRALTIDADNDHLRLIVDMLLHKTFAPDDSLHEESSPSSLWWISAAKSMIQFDAREAMEKIVIPEMTKNRSLQRLTNEFATELMSL